MGTILAIIYLCIAYSAARGCAENFCEVEDSTTKKVILSLIVGMTWPVLFAVAIAGAIFLALGLAILGGNHGPKD